MIFAAAILNAKRRMKQSQVGLTILELLLSMTVLSIIMIAISAAMGTMQNTWIRMREKSDTYRNTRMALDNMSRRIAQATLATRYVQDEEAAASSTEPFIPESDLHFVCGPAVGREKEALQPVGNACGHCIFFQAPFGQPSARGTTNPSEPNQDYNHLSNTLCSWGYYVEYGPENLEVPRFIKNSNGAQRPKSRFRLMEFRQPASEMSLYRLDGNNTPALSNSNPEVYRWFQEPLERGKRPSVVVAENVIAVLFSPYDPRRVDSNTSTFGPDQERQQFQITLNGLYDTRRALWQNIPPGVQDNTYAWESLHRLPSALRITVIATSEDSWVRLTNQQGEGMATQTAGTIQSTINSKFKNSAPEAFRRDLNEVEDLLARLKLDHRTFTIDLKLSEQ